MSSWTLNQRTTFCPAHWLVSHVTCVHAPRLLQTLSGIASVVPDVLRICIWIWSYVSVSGQCGWNQNDSRELPLGIATVCWMTLLPL